jgi:hypothetical protein
VCVPTRLSVLLLPAPLRLCGDAAFGAAADDVMVGEVALLDATATDTVDTLLGAVVLIALLGAGGG